MRFTSTTWRKPSIGSSSAATGAPMPALFTSTSRWPSRAMASATSRSQSASTDTSQVIGTSRSPSSSARASSRSVRRAAATTVAPAACSTRAKRSPEAAGGPGDDGDPAVEAERGGEIDGAHGPKPRLAAVKVRIGYGLGTRASSDPDRFAALVTGLEARRFDSLWLSERVTGDCPDPIVGLGVAAGLTTKIKFGFSVLVVPGPQPDAAGQGAGHPRPAQPRPPAAGVRARRRRPRRAPGLRRRAGRPGQDLQRGAPAAAALLGRRDRRPRRRVPPLRGRRRPAAPRAGPAGDLARRHRPVGAEALRAARRRLAAVVLHPRGRAGGHRRHRGHRRRARPQDRPGALRRPAPLLRRTDPRHRGGRHRQAPARRRPDPRDRRPASTGCRR